MRHAALPQTLTIENLAVWIKENNIETKVHEEKFLLTEQEIAAFEHDSSVASREIDKLTKVKDKFMEYLKKGTPCLDPDNGVFEEIPITIPGTKGIDILKANREYADAQIELGYRTENTQLYGIPYPENRKILFFDIEGNHWEQYNYGMNPIQIQKYGQPLFEEKKFKGKSLIPGFEFEGGDGSKENPFTFSKNMDKEQPTSSGLPWESDEAQSQENP